MWSIQQTDIWGVRNVWSREPWQIGRKVDAPRGRGGRRHPCVLAVLTSSQPKKSRSLSKLKLYKGFD